MIATAVPAGDHYCQGFQPNSFDPSRCSSCLRPRHMHITLNNIYSAPAATAAADDEYNEDETKDYNKDDDADGGQWDGSQYWVRT